MNNSVVFKLKGGNLFITKPSNISVDLEKETVLLGECIAINECLESCKLSMSILKFNYIESIDPIIDSVKITKE